MNGRFPHLKKGDVSLAVAIAQVFAIANGHGVDGMIPGRYCPQTSLAFKSVKDRYGIEEDGFGPEIVKKLQRVRFGEATMDFDSFASLVEAGEVVAV